VDMDGALSERDLDLEMADVLPPRETLTLGGSPINITVNVPIAVGVATGVAIATQVLTSHATNIATTVESSIATAG
jgi:hypothetical protein